MIGVILLVIVVLLLVGAWPSWPHAAYWGYGYGAPSALGIILVVILVLILLGRL